MAARDLGARREGKAALLMTRRESVRGGMAPARQRVTRAAWAVSCVVLASMVAGSTGAAAGMVAPQEAASETPSPPGAHAEPVHEHEPKPIEEVLDQKHGWPIFHKMFGGFQIPLGWFEVGGYKIPTKFMLLELLAAGLIVVIFVGLAKRVENGEPAAGTFWNAFESLLTFIRDEVAKPTLGEHEADKYVPFLWTMFVFILFCNLLGMFPFLGSPTANIYVTGGLATCSFLLLHGAAIAKMGVIHYLQSLWPKIDVPTMFGLGTLLGLAIKIMIFGIELFGTVIKSGVLAVRLFANMFAGHTVLATILFFIVQAKNAGMLLWGTVTAASVAGVIALSLLELFVAFLQAYIFVFLTALFVGMAVHPEH